MNRIIAGMFDASSNADAAARALRNAGFAPDSVSIYHNNAPGQHGLLPSGGDEVADPEAKGAELGAAKGALAGSLIGAGVGGAIGGPLGAVAGAGVGAYTGAFGGALNQLSDDDEDTTLPPVRRPAGIMVAVRLEGGSVSADKAVELLRQDGATAIEQAEGEWRNGQWADFDPLAAPQMIWRRPESTDIH